MTGSNKLFRAIAIPAIADIRTGDDTGVDMNMLQR
jgi:hypothetical protein